ncbi:MAG: DUF1697 domain-containing protein [Sphingobium sp.]
MPRYAAFLASVNVGGNRVSMADLKTALEGCGLERVETVVASGNVLFDHDRASDAALETLIGDCVRERFGFRTFAAVRGVAELKAALAENPFVGGNEDKFVYVHFLARPLTGAMFGKLAQAHAGPEKLAAGTRDLYMDYVEGAGRSKLTAAFIEKHLGCMGTARNIRSINRIVEKMEQ